MESFIATLLNFFTSFFSPIYSPPPLAPVKVSSVPQQPIEASQPTPTITPVVTVLLATGDVMLGRSVRVQTLKSGDPTYPYRYVHELLSSADITLINLENPLTDPCPLTTIGMTFCAPTSAVEGLVFAGIDIANLANNHTRNYGENGYESTKTALNNRSILPSDSADLAVVERNGLRFGFLGFDIITSWPDEQELRSRVKEADQQVNILVVSFHRGVEYADEPSTQERRLLRSVVDAGADLVIGHHPHVVQPVEEYRGALIAYSLGNFIFDQMWSQETREGVVGRFTFMDGALSSFEFIPVFTESIGQPQIVTGHIRASRVYSRLRIQLPDSIEDADDQGSPDDDAR